MSLNEKIVKLKLLDHFDREFGLPSYETLGAAGMDVRASLENRGELIIAPKARVLIPTGLSVAIPQGYEIQVRPRSGLSFKTNLLLTNSPGTIDSDYRGEIKIIMGNMGDEPYVVHHGDRVAQLVLAPVTFIKWEEVNELCATQRGSGGFGSTGRGKDD